MRGDTRSLDYSSNNPVVVHQRYSLVQGMGHSMSFGVIHVSMRVYSMIQLAGP